MSTNYTSHYNLCQWEPSDPVLRTDFNDDNAKLLSPGFAPLPVSSFPQHVSHGSTPSWTRRSSLTPAPLTRSVISHCRPSSASAATPETARIRWKLIWATSPKP